MNDQMDMAFGLAVELSKQLITLAIGIIAFTITFRKEFLGDSLSATKFLGIAWLLFLGSVLSGIWHLMALTGTLAATETATLAGANVRIPVAVQIVAFGLGVIFITVYGLVGLQTIARRRQSQRTAENRASPKEEK